MSLTEQEIFWSGEFGDMYIDRNKEDQLLRSNINLFGNILKLTSNISSVLELGCNIGMNLSAIRHVDPKIDITGHDINKNAIDKLKSKMPDVDAIQVSILNKNHNCDADLVFTKGVLIHISPADLHLVYENLYESSKRYILICEYYDPAPTKINYRGHEDKLFKRDFAGELLDKYADLRLVDYGFCYHRDKFFPQDDMTWFLMEKIV